MQQRQRLQSNHAIFSQRGGHGSDHRQERQQAGTSHSYMLLHCFFPSQTLPHLKKYSWLRHWLDVITIAMHPLVKLVLFDEQSTQLLQDRVHGPVAALTMTPSMIS